MINEIKILKRAANVLKDIHLEFGADELAYLSICQQDALRTLRNKFAYLLGKRSGRGTFVVSGCADILNLDISGFGLETRIWSLKVGYADLNFSKDYKHFLDVIYSPATVNTEGQDRELLQQFKGEAVGFKLLLAEYMAEAEQPQDIPINGQALLKERRQVASVFGGVLERVALKNVLTGVIPAGRDAGIDVEIFYMLYQI